MPGPGIEPVYDFAEVKIDNTPVWSKDRGTGTAPWIQVTLSLEPYIGGSHNLQFVFSSDESNQFEGWYLDDIQVTDDYTPGPPPPNDNFSAAAVLSGAVGMLTSTTVSATAEANEPSDVLSATNSVWFKWQCLTNGTVKIGRASCRERVCLAV